MEMKPIGAIGGVSMVGFKFSDGVLDIDIKAAVYEALEKALIECETCMRFEYPEVHSEQAQKLAWAIRDENMERGLRYS